MNFFKKLFNIPESPSEEVVKQEVYLTLDDLFVHKFITKGGKFLYCTKKDEVLKNLQSIFLENNWVSVHLLDDALDEYVDHQKIAIFNKPQNNSPILTFCEQLIADNGDIMFSSNQLKSTKISDLPDNFIVLAYTSQIVKDTGQGLTGIKSRFKYNLPTNISSIKSYDINKTDDNFLSYGNNNVKNLYLLLLEDL